MRWIIAPFTAAMVLLDLAFRVSPAAAVTGNGTGQACKHDYGTFNACLNIFPGTEPYQHSVIVGIDLKMPTGYAWQALRRGSHFQATLRSSAITSPKGVELPARSGWPQAGPNVLSAQFGFDNMFLDRVGGRNAFQAEIVFTEVHADGSTIHTYETGVLQDSTPVDDPPLHCPWFCS